MREPMHNAIRNVTNINKKTNYGRWYYSGVCNVLYALRNNIRISEWNDPVPFTYGELSSMLDKSIDEIKTFLGK